MTTTRMKTEGFKGKNDFGLWQIKMKVILLRQGLAEILNVDPKAKETVNIDYKVDMGVI